MKLKLNKKAPNFKLPSTNGKIFELRKIKKNIVIYFYPKDDTPGCTLESRDFNKLNNIFKKKKNFSCRYFKRLYWKSPKVSK